MSDERRDRDSDDGLSVEEAKPRLRQPPMYRVLLLNDDYTPMDFVVEILETFFNLDRSRATQVMLQVHQRGSGTCGIFTRDVAETKVEQVNDYAREHGHPLLCTMEED